MFHLSHTLLSKLNQILTQANITFGLIITSFRYEQRYGTDAYLSKALGASSISDEISREINSKYNVSDSNRRYVGE